MAFTGNYMATSFKLELLSGIHAFNTSVVHGPQPPSLLAAR
mgnify:CR=1 FL=1